MALVVGTNSYIDVTDATTYFNDSLNSLVWQAIDPTTQAQALVTATRMLDKQTWSGLQSNPGVQTLQWPRTGVVDRYGQPIDPTMVPQQILDATCELALAIQADSTVQTNPNTNFNIRAVKAGTAEVEYFRPSNGGRFPTIIQELVGQFIGGGIATATGIATGTCEESKFDKRDPYRNYDVYNGFS